MSVSQKQTVEIVKALYRGADILSSTSRPPLIPAGDGQALCRIAHDARDDGKAIVIITHKMHEVEALSDRGPCCATASSWAICSPRTPTRRR